MFGKYRLLLLRCFLLLLLPLALLCPKGVISAEVKISSTSEFINFAGNVSRGTSYKGTTVLLDSDLSLSGKTLEPIGNNTYYFRGVFDGQGYIISNLKMNTSSSQYAGLFEFSEGLTIKNVVLDSSCSITSSFNGSSYVYAGGIIGRCYSWYGQCNIENSVNMAGVTFSGNITSYSNLNLGGIVGRLGSSYNYPSYMKNCANYGSITHSGTTKYYSYIGGIVGYLEGYSSNYAYIQNCLNYGTITHSGTTSNYLRIGGIVGYSEYAYIENSVSAGRISMQTTPSSRYIGTIVGYVSSYTFINYCYYTSDLSSFSLYGTGTPKSTSYTLSYDSTTFGLSEPVSVGSYTGTSLVDALNAAADYYILRDYSKWLLNKNTKTVTFTINSRTSPITMNSKVILLPSLASEGSLMFYGWYTDNNCATPLSSFEITGDTGLYGKFEENTNGYTITFESRREGVSVASITAQFGATVSLPRDIIRDNCSVAFWETGYGDNMGLSLTMPAHNFVLYAVWKCTHIASLDDFIDFSRTVNSGSSYSGTTVLLDSDLSLSGKTLEPIGKDSNNYFRGVFDGQGHIISNLKMNTSSQYTGLFGYSGGLTIKNVVLDSSCSITSYYSSSSERAYVGGIIGYCTGQCNIENSVNMADVTFSGNSYNLRLGGIAGELYPSSTNSYVKNCANYGSVLKNGVVDSWSNIGGVIAFIESSYSSYTYVYNCINYGTVTHKNSSNYIYMGGILGSSYDNTYIENCVSAGEISSPNTATYNEIGNIVGYIDSYSSIYIKNCYYSDELDNYKLYSGYGYVPISGCSKYNSTTFGLSEPVSVGSYTGTSLVDALNAYPDYYILRDYSKWLLNKISKTVTFTINSRTSLITMNSKLILLPSLASEGSTFFDGWYTDNNCANPLSSFEITEDTGLYGKFEENTKNYTITFDTKGGSYVAPITAQSGTTVSLPRDIIRDNCSVAFWENKYGDNMGLSLTMPAHNFVLYAVWKCTLITSPGDLVDFSKVVNSGSSYSGTTVLLDSDLSLSGKTLEPIGKDSNNYFRGVFDGQGHIISNLKMNSSSSQYAGLFGYSRGLTIKNVVLDSSCSITNFYNDSNNVYVGGIIGYCYGQCNIENSVNMADVTFSGYIGNNNLYLGGIVGRVGSSSGYPAYVKNCANYGSVTHSGTTKYSCIGGIVGYLEGYDPNYAYIQNSLNHGTITHSGTTSNYLRIGGISGYSEHAYIENSVSAGRISLQTTPSYNYTGSIVGYVYSPTYINHSFWSGDVGYNKTSGYGSPSTDNETAQAEVDTALVGKLNGYSANNSWNNWTMLHTNGGRICNVNQDSLITPSKHFPVPVKEGYILAGWFKDAMFSETYDPNVNGTCADAYARFTPNDYTVTLNATGGSVSTSSVTVTFDSAYGELPMPNRTGYTFVRWSNEINESVTSETIVKTPNNHTLYAQWEEVKTNQVEIVFGSKDLDREDIEKIVKEYTNAEFEIVLIEDGDADEKRVIIKFTGTEEAEEFVRNVRTSAEEGDIGIKEIGYSTEEFDSGSFSWFLHPLLFINALVV